MSKNLGLIGSITYDEITYASGDLITGLGGVLYQAAVLCGLEEEVFLHAHLSEELVDKVERTVENWTTLHKEGILSVSGPGNQVHLHYPKEGERIETLKSVVEPLDPDPILKGLDQMAMLILVINSGLDIQLPDWQRIVHAASCPVWVDIHSLFLTKWLGVPRKYSYLPEWKDWVEGISYLQANVKEVASMLGHPQTLPSEAELIQFGEAVFDLRVKAVFLTLGKEGVLALKPGESFKVAAGQAERVVDTTGCGDVFCGGTVVKLASGEDAFEATRFGVELATKAAGVKGVAETFKLASEHKRL
ncbi:MAG: carbohydrate kinase family protein [Candidatus Aminicenantes bacterium]|nr:carbohydrate kinase family protein [Candidatus Aminicenantes bacterium]